MKQRSKCFNIWYRASL